MPELPPKPFASSGTASQPSSPPRLYRGESDYMRDRAMTTSTYASTAKPPQLESTHDFGGGFDNMFDGLDGDRKSSSVPPVPPASTYGQRVRVAAERRNSNVEFQQPEPESLLFPPPRMPSRQSNSPSPTLLQRPPRIEQKRYSWDSRHSTEQLLSGPSSEIGSPNSEVFPPVARPSSTAPLAGLNVLRGYQTVPNRQTSPEIRDARASPASNSGFTSAQSHHFDDPSAEPATALDAVDERAVWKTQLRRPTGQHTQREVSKESMESTNAGGYRVPRVVDDEPNLGRLSPSPSNTVSPARDSTATDSINTTPRAKIAVLDTEEQDLFDSSPAGPASRAISPGKQRARTDITPKRMTTAQFEQLQRQSGFHEDDDDDNKSTISAEELDDEDEVERQKVLAQQRRRQEATMSVYRQQMKKVTGGTMSDLPSQRPGFERSGTSGLPTSMSSMSVGGTFSGDTAGDDEDDDVPLGILQAHGFPTRTRPPNQMPGSNPGYAGSMAGGAAGDLPAFARRLPQDPYYGAGLVNPAQREPLSFGQGGGSVYGGSAYGGSAYGGNGAPQMAQPGGLVGVIAGEERAKAARRGSPNPITGGYGPIPLPGSMQQGQQIPQFGRSQSMQSLSGFMPQNGMLPGQPAMSPYEHAAWQSQQQMQQMMQMQAQWMQMMMQGNMPGMPPMQMPGYPALPQSSSMNSLGVPDNNQRRVSGSPSLAHQGRSMTMMTPPSQFNDNYQQRAQTMGSNPARPPYAGSVYGMNGQMVPQGGYTPSIAPSERSNIGMPSRYRPVADGQANGGASRSQTMTSLSFPGTRQEGRPVSPLGALDANANKTAKTMIRVVEKPRGAPKSPLLRNSNAEDENDEEGWAEMAKKREAMRKKRHTKAVPAEPELAGIMSGYE